MTVMHSEKTVKMMSSELTGSTTRKGPLGAHWSPLKGAWVDAKGRIVKEGKPSKSKGIIASALVCTLLGYMFVGTATSKTTPTKSPTSITKTVTYSGNDVTFTQVK
jgi:hypothetical protein